MQFVSPTSLLWLLLAVPIVVLYILKIRLRRVPVSTMMFWDQVFDQRTPRSIWQKLRHVISLLMQLAFLSLVAFAVADPFLTTEQLTARQVVLVVDNSASMTALDGVVTRLDEAKRRGARLINGLRFRDRMAIVSTGAVPKVVCGLTNHQRTLRRALTAVSITHGPTRVHEAVEMAKRLLSGQENPQIVVLTDGCFDGVEVLAAENAAQQGRLANQATVQLDIVGTPIDNVAITKFQVRRSLNDVIGYQVFVEVTNYSDEATECRLEVSLGNDLVDVVPLHLEPDQPHRHFLDHASAVGGRLLASIDVQDSLPVDNQAVAIVPKRQRQSVLLVTQGNLFLQSALAAIPLVDLRSVKELPKSIPTDVIVFFDGETPNEIPVGNVFVVQPTSSTDLWKLGVPIKDPLVTDQDSDSPLMTHVQLENVLMPAARTLELSAEHRVLASSIGGEPLYVMIDRPPGKVLVMAVDLDVGDLPLRTAFPIMMTNAINWFRGERAELQPAVATGTTVHWQLNATANDLGGAVNGMTRSAVASAGPNRAGKGQDETSILVLRGPDGTDKALPNNADRLTLGPFAQSGVWQVLRVRRNATESSNDQSETVVAEYACNLTDSQESNLRFKVELPKSKAAQASALDSRPIWFYLVALALVLSTVEWFMYQRRWIS